MLENARRQVFLVLITALAAAMFAVFLKPNLGNDIQGGVQLIYEVPVEHLKKQEQAGSKPDQVMNETLAVIRDRVDPTGTLEALVTRRGGNGILIELPAMEADLEQIVEERIQSLGKLEMRIVATDEPPDGGNKFNLAEEKKRLETWLNQRGGKQLVLDNWKNIEQFNSTPPESGGPEAFGKLAWFAHFITPSLHNNKLWNYSFAKQGSLPAVVVFDDAQWNNGVIPANADTNKGLLEYLAVDMKERFFRGEDLDASGVSAGVGQGTSPVVHYKLKTLTAEYGDWSEKYIGKHSAIILNNVVKSAPVFKSRIPGSGMIEGDFTQREVDDLVKVLRTGSLRVEPRFVSKSVIGPTLGAKSLNKGLLSLVAGAAAVFAFMVLYYRMAGLVACVALLLNALLLYAGMLISQATVTLPGLGGMVLTMGMAVDANVLIYERIREELAKGKDLLRSVRAGFDRAMVTILDTHVTTFLSGLVLYGVGVGPVRGFAVTLMWGLVTTVFTQFFVARLMFHYLLEWKVLKQYRTTNWLTGVRIDFVRLMVINLVLSSVVIVGGLLYAATVPAEKMLGLDFTGGANLQMVLDRPTTAQEVRSVIEGDAEFKRLFASPTVNYVGDPDAQGLYNTFNARLKLTDQMRAQIEAAREQWQQQRQAAQNAGQPMPPDYVPPYLDELKRLFAGKLVQPAASGARVTPTAREGDPWAFAEISLHFQEPVSLKALEDQFKKGLREVSVKDDKQTGATESREVFVQWNVLAKTRDAELLGIVREALGDLKTASGAKLVLSNPFPEAEEIGGRMVGELRSAAIGALILSWALIILYLRVRYHEYRYGIAAVLALIHDLLVTFGVVVLFNSLGIVHAEIDLNMIACFLTIVGYSVNDTIVVFDRIRENAAEDARLGVHEAYGALINRSLNQTLSRTVLSSGVTLCAVLAQLLVNWGSGSALESFAFGFSIGIISGTYSSIYIAAPLLLWWHKHDEAHLPPGAEGTVGRPEPAPVTTAG